MAKGQITEYEGPAFSSAAVGVPGKDQSAQIIAQGVVNVGKALAQHQDASDDLSAMSTLGDFQVAYANQKLELQQKFRDAPSGYAEATRLAASKLADQYGKKLGAGAQQKFRQLTTSVLAQDADNLVVWSARRENEIDVGNILNIKQNIAIEATTVNSAEGLRAVLMKFPVASVAAQKKISPESDGELTLRYAKLAKENALMSQIEAQPAKVLRDLKGETYKDILTPDEVTSYITKARTAIHNRAEDDFYRRLYTAQGEVYDLQQKVDAGEITPAELITRRQAAWVNKDQKDANGNPIFSPAYFSALDNLLAQMLHTGMTLPPEQAEQRKNALQTFDSDWEQFLAEKKQAGGGPAASDVEEELAMYAKLSDLYGKGVIDKADFDTKVDVMRTKLALRIGKSPVVMSFNQALEEAGKSRWFRDSSNDVFVYGYRYIKDYVDKAYTTLDPTSKQELKAQILAQYTQQVKSLPENSWKGIKNDIAKQTLAHDLVMGDGKTRVGVLARFSVYVDPDTQKSLFVGDEITKNGIIKVFSGLNPETGQPMWRLPEYKVNQVISTPNGLVEITRFDNNGNPIVRRVNGR